MSKRLFNNLVAGLIVVVFWMATVIPAIVKAADPIVSNSTVTSTGTQTTTVKSPPPSAIASQITSSSSDFLCSVSASGAIQTQILGISLGAMHEDELCQTLQLSHALYNMGMKVAAISVLCENEIVFRSMAHAGSYCPYDSLLGEDAKAAWEVHTDKIPKPEEEDEATAKEKREQALGIMGSIAAAFMLF